MGGQVEGFDGREEGGFAGVVEAEEEDGVFCWGGRGWGLVVGWEVGEGMGGREEEPSLLVA